MPRIVLPSEIGGETIAISGPSGSGKTRLACAAMRAEPSMWGEKALYIAIDPGSAKLRSVLREDLDHLHPVVLGDEPGKSYDPYEEVLSLVDSHDYPTTILDTATVLARDTLQALANSGKFSDKHIEISKTKIGKMNVPMMGDYGATQSCMFNVYRAFYGTGKNLIVLFHEQVVEPDADSSAPTIIGPATVGKASVAATAAWFDNLIRTEVRTKITGPTKETQYWVHTETKKPYLAKLRLPTPTNPMPEFKLDTDPANFWRKYKEITQ